MADHKGVRTRIAPSPTGDDLHIGNLYTALFNWAFAKKHNGQFIVRVEDTDQKRKIDGSEERIMQTLKDFGLQYDEGIDAKGKHDPYRQSERLDIYKKHADQLIKQKNAYYCFCTPERLSELREQQRKEKKPPKYDKHCFHNIDDADERVKNGEKYVIRLNVPDNREVTFTDEIRGEITINSNNFDDQVLIKSDGFPTYHMAVVVDDHLMEISHIIRGEEWISSTPKHVLLYEAFGWDLPVFAHVPLLRNQDKSKLSKRKNPVWARWYLDEGYLPQAVLNFLALMGWSHPEEKEIFPLEEFVQVIDLQRFQTVGPVFDLTKLQWMNGEYIRAMDLDMLVDTVQDFYGEKYSRDLLYKIAPLIQERIKTFKEFDQYGQQFLEAPTEYEKDISDEKEIIQGVIEVLTVINDADWQADNIGQRLQDLAQQRDISFGKFFMTLRVAVTGKKVTPPFNESVEVLGKEEVLSRLKLCL